MLFITLFFILRMKYEHGEGCGEKSLVCDAFLRCDWSDGADEGEEGVEQETGENKEDAPRKEQDAWCKSMRGLAQGVLYKKPLGGEKRKNGRKEKR